MGEIDERGFVIGLCIIAYCSTAAAGLLFFAFHSPCPKRADAPEAGKQYPQTCRPAPRLSSLQFSSTGRPASRIHEQVGEYVCVCEMNTEHRTVIFSRRGGLSSVSKQIGRGVLILEYTSIDYGPSACNQSYEVRSIFLAVRWDRLYFSAVALFEVARGTISDRMRVSYRKQHPGVDGDIPDFLRSDFVSGTWERTGK